MNRANCCCGGGRICPTHGDTTPEQRPPAPPVKTRPLDAAWQGEPEHPFDKKAADELAYQCARLVKAGVLGSRSAVGDALLGYLRIGSRGWPPDGPTWMAEYERSRGASVEKASVKTEAAPQKRRSSSAAGTTEWVRLEPVEPPTCDICNRRAKWGHPEGGKRCGSCPRPNSKKSKPEWTGTYREMRGPNGTCLKWAGRWWIIRDAHGNLVDRYDSRDYAYRKARKIDASASRT